MKDLCIYAEGSQYHVSAHAYAEAIALGCGGPRTQDGTTGFVTMLNRVQISDLHRWLGNWLVETKK